MVEKKSFAIRFFFFDVLINKLEIAFWWHIEPNYSCKLGSLETQGKN